MIRYLRSTVLALVAASLLGVSGAGVGVAQEATPAADCPSTTPEENEALVRLYWQEAVWGAQGAIDEVVAPDEVHHWGIAGDTTGIEEFMARWALFNAAFPDLEFTVDQVVTEGDLVASLWTATGTQSGEWQGIAPTEREVTWSGINVFRIECGLIAESWGEADHLGLRQQLGASDVAATPLAGGAEAMTVPAATPCADDSPERNVEVVRRWTDDVWNGKNLGALDEIADPAIVHDGGAFPVSYGVEAVKAAIGATLAVFPDMTLTIDQTVAQGDTVVVRWSGTGTHEGDYFGIAPTGKSVNFTGTNLYHLSCGRIVQSWSFIDGLGLLQQLREPAAEATPA